jgi:hypothetical protein
MVWVQVMHDFNPVQLVFPLWKPVPKNLPGYMQLCSDNRKGTEMPLAMRNARRN